MLKVQTTLSSCLSYCIQLIGLASDIQTVVSSKNKDANTYGKMVIIAMMPLYGGTLNKRKLLLLN